MSKRRTTEPEKTIFDNEHFNRQRAFGPERIKPSGAITRKVFTAEEEAFWKTIRDAARGTG